MSQSIALINQIKMKSIIFLSTHPKICNAYGKIPVNKQKSAGNILSYDRRPFKTIQII